jgi:hypothetical protein
LDGGYVNIVVEDFGWAPLIAEYDAQEDSIRVNARIVDRMRALCGEAAALALIACAVAHETYHARHPNSTEAQAHAYAHAVTGHDPHRIEAMLQ